MTTESVVMNQDGSGETSETAPPTYNHGGTTTTDVLINLVDFSAYYGALEVLKNINLTIERKKITVFMGPSGCGKSTLVRTLNRMNDDVNGFRISGKVLLDGEDIYAPTVDPVLLKTRVGMVFQKPNPFPISIYDNVAFGPRIHKTTKGKSELDSIVKESLQKAALWDEVKDRLGKSAWGLSGGQQQRLCIARALAVRPEVILMDEPASALDPGSTSKVEELMVELKENYTVVLVTHNMQQAARVGTSVAFLYKGDLVEFGPAGDVFENPQSPLTEKYIRGSL
ncbi:MAG: phosphate ABC transporter ATP-binding protein PstB [Nitrososphaerales archaeon]|jgi:phosphate transport system ATP-binding protein